MNNKQIIQEFRLAITEARDAGRKTIKILALEEFLQSIELEINKNGEINENKLQARIVEFRAENERNLAQYNAEVSSNLEIFRSGVTAGLAATRAMIIINGGACVAILAFIGGLFEKKELLAKSLAITLLYFALGVLSGGLVAGLTYLNQAAYNEGKDQLGNVIRVICIVVGLTSYIFFAVGGYQAYSLISAGSG
jgi:hypothetical protein